MVILILNKTNSIFKGGKQTAGNKNMMNSHFQLTSGSPTDGKDF